MSSIHVTAFNAINSGQKVHMRIIHIPEIIRVNNIPICKVIRGMGRLEKHKHKKGTWLFSLIHKLQYLSNVHLVTFPWRYTLILQFMHKSSWHIGKYRTVQFRVGKALTGIYCHLIFLTQQGIHKNRAYGLFFKRIPVIGIQAIKHGEHTHPGTISSAVVTVKLQGHLGKMP